jgi:hypothetical protein
VGGTGPSGAPLDRWPRADVATSRWLAGTPDCPSLHTDGPVNYSRRRLKFLRADYSADRATDCPMGGTGPSGSTQTSRLSLFSILISFAHFGLTS